MNAEPTHNSGSRFHDISVRSAAGTYSVRVGEGAMVSLPELLHLYAPAHRYALIGDENVLQLYGEEVAERVHADGARLTTLSFPPGEASKTRKEWARLTDALLESGIGRDGCILALGGGVTGDLAGFVAATYLRGVPVVQLPTSLVAMIDSSVGGKTGVDTRHGKNLVGVFHPPRFVLIDTRLAETLPRRERIGGMAEAVKHGLILDPSYLEWIESHAEELLEGDPERTTHLVRRSVELKAQVVSEDEHEGGYREILNFGHTLGHALEAASDYTLSHGEAVAMGMVLETRLGEELGITAPGSAEQVARVLRRIGLPHHPPPGIAGEEVYRLLFQDKKVRGDAIRIVMIGEPGRVDGEVGWARPIPNESVRALLSYAPSGGI